MDEATSRMFNCFEHYPHFVGYYKVNDIINVNIRYYVNRIQLIDFNQSIYDLKLVEWCLYSGIRLGFNF